MHSIFRKMQQFKECRHSLKFPRTYLFIYLNSFVLLTPDTILQFIFSATDIRAVAGNWWNTRTRGTQGRLRWQQILSVWIIIKLSAAPVFAVCSLCVCSPRHITRDNDVTITVSSAASLSTRQRGQAGPGQEALGTRLIYLVIISRGWMTNHSTGFRTELRYPLQNIWDQYNIFPWIYFLYR